MFTGIIEEVGQIKALKNGVHSVTLTVAAHKVLDQTVIGDSISTNGICLTVTHITPLTFSVDVMYETLKRSNIKDLTIGCNVNLERALTLQTRLGGHMVSGHVDGVGIISMIHKEDIAYVFKINTTPEITKYMIKKGSVALDGVSLTIVDVSRDSFTVSIIPHTKNQTTLFEKKIGDTLNIECDLISKYVEKLLHHQKEPQGITTDMLKTYGF